MATQRRLSRRRLAARSRLHLAALLGVVAVVYFAVAKLGLSFAADHEIVSAVWFPAGIALAAVVVFGHRVWPAIALAALVANATGDSSLATAAGIAAGNTIAALAAGWMLGRAGFDPALRRVGDVVALALLGAGAATALNATVGVGTLSASGAVGSGELWELWRLWWLRDLTGVLLVAPALLVASTARPRIPRPVRVVEASALALLVVAMTVLVLNEAIVIAYPVFALIVLAAMRFRQPGAVLVAPAVAALAIAFTANGEGPFVGGSVDDELLRSQVFAALAALAGLLIAAMRSEWEQAERAVAKLAASEGALAEAQRLAHIGSWEWDIAADRVRFSEELHRIFGAAPGAFAASYAGFLGSVHEDDRERVETIIAGSLESGEPFEYEARVVRPSSEERIVACHGRIVGDSRRKPVKMTGTCQDVTEQRAAQERFHDLLESAPDAMVIVDEAGEIVLINSQAELMLGHRRTELIGEPLASVIPEPAADVDPEAPTLFPAEPAIPRPLGAGERIALRNDGTEIPIEVSFSPLRTAGRVLTLGAIRDVSARKLAERRLEHQALHDPLTGLPNRTLFLDRLGHALARSRRPGSNLAAYFCDIDNFKRINDSLGHEAGDELLMALPARLRQALRQADTVARFGGDEFVILCEDFGSEAAAIRIAERITEAFERPFVLDGSAHHLSISVGVVFVEGGQASASEVLRHADVAMYRAKARGKGKFELFDAKMRSRVLERLAIETDLRRAIDDDALRLAYQPVLSLESGEFVSAEALLRWQHPARGLLAPPDFIDVAEDSGLIVPVGAWVIREACRSAAAWSGLRPAESPLAVSINVSPRQVSDWNFVDLLRETIEETGVDPDLVELEITEAALVEDADAALVTLTQLKEIGVRLVLDDFGTGHSSLSRLKRFPIDALKVDREFIAGIGDDGENTAIVSAVLSVASALGVDVIAEGVETAAQLDWLAEHGCRFAQGYLLSRPLGIVELEGLEPWPGGAGSAGSPMPVGGPLA
ncbi:MAG TPA: EAL domain-containing protein [Solirubrobacterales bacterium]|nr:EAL domain-containing protein [Solirubrobacterales bacterium]